MVTRWNANLYSVKIEEREGAVVSSSQMKIKDRMGNFPGGSDGKASTLNEGDLGSIPGSRRCPGEGNGNPLQYSCLGIPMDRGAWRATVHGVAKNRT